MFKIMQFVARSNQTAWVAEQTFYKILYGILIFYIGADEFDVALPACISVKQFNIDFKVRSHLGNTNFYHIYL